MKLYLVGGAVRDALMGVPPGDRDWVAVGATPEQMLAAGFTPVGRDFPVFLHPVTREEVALARTERKTGPGYHGFVFHADPKVTLKDDLGRRDLTINAIAQDEVGRLVDPFGGQHDLANHVLRHVSPAFVEDPVRILRVARFAARWPEFRVADETLALMRGMVRSGEAAALVAERVWQELARGMMERQPSRMFDVLRACGALAVVLPEVDRLWGVPQPRRHHPEIDTGVHLMLVLDMAARRGASLAVRFACLTHDLGKGTTPPALWPSHRGHEERSVTLLRGVCERLRVPGECRELAEVVAREHGHIQRCTDLDAAGLLRLLERCDALRRPQRMADIVLACECDARGRLGRDEAPYPQAERLERALAAALSVDTAAVAGRAAERGQRGPAVGQAIHAARAAAIAAAIADAHD
jgi:tRNA nucleotidyltransferase (CCA-adding enzyme)